MRIQPNRTKGDFIFQMVNYTVRIFVILIGLFFLIGFKVESKMDISSFRLLGLVITLFGIYRLVMYHLSIKRYNFNLKNDDDEN